MRHNTEGADDIGLDEFTRAVDGAIDVALRSQIHHGIGSIFVEQFSQLRAVADVGALEGIVWIPRCVRDRIKVGRIGQLVDVDDAGAGVAQQMADYRRADEAGAAVTKIVDPLNRMCLLKQRFSGLLE